MISDSPSVCGFISTFTCTCICMSLQMNYEYLCSCVEAAPVPLMPASAWECILHRIGVRVLFSPLSMPLLPTLNQEVQVHYEDTIRRSNVLMTLVRPSIDGLHPEPQIPADPLLVTRVGLGRGVASQGVRLVKGCG